MNAVCMFFKVVISLLLLSQALLEENRHVFFYFYFFMRGYTFQEMCVCFFRVEMMFRFGENLQMFIEVVFFIVKIYY